MNKKTRRRDVFDFLALQEELNDENSMHLRSFLITLYTEERVISADAAAIFLSISASAIEIA